MNARSLPLWLLFVTMSLGCSGAADAPARSSADVALPAAPMGSSPVVNPDDPIPEMREFLGQLDGNAEHIKAAADQFAAPGVSTSDLTFLLVKDPKIAKTEHDGDTIIYTVDTKAGIFDWTFKIHWKNRQITELWLVRDAPAADSEPKVDETKE